MKFQVDIQRYVINCCGLQGVDYVMPIRSQSLNILSVQPRLQAPGAVAFLKIFDHLSWFCILGSIILAFLLVYLMGKGSVVLSVVKVFLTENITEYSMQMITEK